MGFQNPIDLSLIRNSPWNTETLELQWEHPTDDEPENAAKSSNTNPITASYNNIIGV